MNAKHKREKKFKEQVPAQVNEKKQKNIPSKEMDKQIGKNVNIWMAY